MPTGIFKKLIEKLLALADSSNEHEARMAAAKVNELLVKYNISWYALDAARRGRIKLAEITRYGRIPT